MKKRLLLVLLSLLMVVSMCLAGCGAKEEAAEDATEDTAEETAPEEDKGITVGMIISQGSYFYQSVEDALRPLIEADGGELIVTNANNDVTKEASTVQAYIEREVDLILLATQSTTASLAAVQQASELGIPVVCYNNGLEPADAEKYTKAYIESDNTALGTDVGKFAAAYIKENLGGTVNLGVIHADCFEICKQRHEGFIKALEDEGVTVNVVGAQESWMADEAAPLATDIITANPEINAFWASNDGGTSGAISAVKTSGKDIVVFGTDMNTELGNYLLDGSILKCTVGQDGFGMGEVAYEVAKKVIAGEEVDPFTISVAGTVFSVDDLDAVKAHLEEIQ